MVHGHVCTHIPRASRMCSLNSSRDASAMFAPIDHTHAKKKFIERSFVLCSFVASFEKPAAMRERDAAYHARRKRKEHTLLKHGC